MELSHDDVREILRLVDESELAELRIETRGFTLHVQRGGAPAAASPPAPAPLQEPAAPAPAAEADAPADDGLLVIAAPLLGTFYRAEAPGAQPFVAVGSRVTPDTIVGIVEVMKMMNSVPAGMSGTIVEVCQANAQLVEYGQPLFRVEPA